ncbi:hypothetical protein LINPERPRIM_LOCUS29851, partial [Linum perenne]
CDKWHTPAPTFIKINCDAALFAEHHAFGIGLVARDEDGVLIGYKMMNRQGCPPVKECEAEVVVAGVEWAVEQGLHRVILETDCQTVQLAMGRESGDMTEFGDIITKGRTLLEKISRYEVNFVRRSGNTVAHALAKQSLFSSNTVYGSKSPDWLCNMLNDCCSGRH